MKIDKMPTKKVFTDNINALIAERKCNAAKIVRDTMISQPRISILLNINNDKLPSAIELLQLSDFFDVSIDRLLKDKDTLKTKELSNEPNTNLTQIEVLAYCLDRIIFDEASVIMETEEECDIDYGFISREKYGIYFSEELSEALRKWDKYTHEICKDKYSDPTFLDMLTTLKQGFLTQYEDILNIPFLPLPLE